MGPPMGLRVRGSYTPEEEVVVEVDWPFEFAVGAGRGYTVVARQETRRSLVVEAVVESEPERQPMVKRDREEVVVQADLD